MLCTRVGSSNISNTRWSIIARCRIGSAGRVVFSRLWRLSWSLLATSSTCRRYHIDLSAERLTLLGLSGLPCTVTCCILLGGGLALASECEMLLRLALCGGGMLGAMVIASARSLNVWLRGLRLMLLLIWGVVATRGIDGLIILTRNSHDIIIGRVTFGFFNQLDYLLCVVKLRVISDWLSDDELFLFVWVYRVSLIYRGGTTSSSTIIVFEVVDQLNFVGAEDFVRLPLLLLTFARMRLGPYILCSLLAAWRWLFLVLLLLLLTPRAFSLFLAFVVTRHLFDYYGTAAVFVVLILYLAAWGDLLHTVTNLLVDRSLTLSGRLSMHFAAAYGLLGF